MIDQKPVEQELVELERRRMTTVSGRHFVGIWKVIAGNPVEANKKGATKGTVATKQYEMLILSTGANLFSLSYRQVPSKAWTHLQTLTYMADTHTLENRIGEDGRPLRRGPKEEDREPERCLTFWNCRVRSQGEKCAIFALRFGKNPGDDSQLPGFEMGTNGSWGAEEGGG